VSGRRATEQRLNVEYVDRRAAMRLFVKTLINAARRRSARAMH